MKIEKQTLSAENHLAIIKLLISINKPLIFFEIFPVNILGENVGFDIYTSTKN